MMLPVTTKNAEIAKVKQLLPMHEGLATAFPYPGFRGRGGDGRWGKGTSNDQQIS